MRIVANGKPYEVGEGTTVADFIRQRDLDPRHVVVERNGEPLERARYEELRLGEGDRLELVRAVAGGSGRMARRRAARKETSAASEAPDGRAGSADRRERLAAARLYVVTDARVDRGDLEAFADAILGAGVDVVQLREKGAEAEHVLRWARVLREAADRRGALFIVNDRPDVALAAGADGVHLGQGDLPVGVAREILGPDRLIGLSTHRPEEWDAAPAEADYLTAGPVWPTPTKPGRPAAGLDHVTHAAAHADRPWFAIGGIDPENVGEVAAAGATRIAVVRAVTEADDPPAAARALLAGLSAARS